MESIPLVRLQTHFRREMKIIVHTLHNVFKEIDSQRNAGSFVQEQNDHLSNKQLSIIIEEPKGNAGIIIRGQPKSARGHTRNLSANPSDEFTNNAKTRLLTKAAFYTEGQSPFLLVS
ncbi:hypothetical protein TNIN_410401 [Trichonephila inaurata madagascariensis]|uniref:Uncharacterized protein n=1 Tax=Trichonephila inaurata madagascariensis TaxID=2747483 RepID=A0A8X6XG20_9ARAC|nr:hypothetical protein TNIN_410401 [Trichonephila inaurata madagascariensis]